MSRKHLSVISIVGALAFGASPAYAEGLWENFLKDAGKVVDKVDVFSDDPEESTTDTSEKTLNQEETGTGEPDQDTAKAPETSEPAESSSKPSATGQADSSQKAQIVPKPKPARPSAVIKEAQALLAELGYDPGPADGLYGKRTGKAVSNFQKDRGTRVTGDVTEGLLSELKKAQSEKLAAAEPQSEEPSIADGGNEPPVAAVKGSETDGPIPAIAADVRTFDFRGIRLGDSLEDVAAALPSMRIETDAGENNVIIGYRGLWTSENKKDVIRVTFTHDGRLYSLNNGQTLSPSLTAETLFNRIAKKYGEGEPTDGTLIYQTSDPEIDQARFNVNIRSANDGTYVAINLFDSKLARKSDEAVEAAKLAAKSRIAKDLKL